MLMNPKIEGLSVRKMIEKRNLIFQKLRRFFNDRQVLEVDTSLVREFSVTDPYMQAFSVKSPTGEHCGYLQTSPEYAMKQLLCNGSGDIFQLSN